MKLSCYDIREKLKKGLISFISSKNEKQRGEVANNLFMFCVRITRNDFQVEGTIEGVLEQTIEIILNEFSEYDLYYGKVENYQGILFTGNNLKSFSRNPQVLNKKINRLIPQL